MESPNLKDIFESAVNLEEKHFDEGFKDGYSDGLIIGKQEGREVGMKHGFQVGEELGFYKGCVDIWTSVIHVNSHSFSSRVLNNIKQMKELIDKYPMLDPENENVQEIMEALRLKYRAITATLGVKLDYRCRQRMIKMMLACCKLYISESRNRSALDLIEQAAKVYPEAVIVNKFKDEIYNRVGYTLVSKCSQNPSQDASPLPKAVFSMVKAAVEAISLELHHGSHPRLGVVDHICFHPLAQASLEQVAGLATLVAGDIGYKLQVPTFLYGAAHEERRTLDSIRRQLGYFKPNSEGNNWVGGPKSGSLPLQPDAGPLQVAQSAGVVVVGATGWVDNFNVPVYSSNLSAVRKISKKLSGRGGGLESVQAMALAHGDGSIEVACNLLNPQRVGADQVQLEVERLARIEGLAVGQGYFTDFSKEVIIDRYLKRQRLDN
ncbi:hypothetical protein H6P81_005647 [Aristolochia fimbriata]|uniref:glutamate formimidoyltransferase n=1 Tax=Aristolochia fimbriata TaxID=158543 RepID=A0AAV7EVJ4_ARIFI|nr:hypothetical protein H6P81_005647 [Aristolochia fimbriata]